MSSRRPPMAAQSRRASSTSLSECESQSARLRPRSHWSRTTAATWRPLPHPVPSPSIQPRRKRTGSERVSPPAGRERVAGLRLVRARVVVGLFHVRTVDGLPARADAVEGGEMVAVGLAGEHDALDLGVREQAVGNDRYGQRRPVGGKRVRYRGHGGGLHQGRRMGRGVAHQDGAGAPGPVGAGGFLAVRRAAGVAGVAELRDGAPVPFGLRGVAGGRGARLGRGLRDRPGMAEQVGGAGG